MKTAEVILEYAPYIDYQPKSPKELYNAACASDEITVSSWRPTWEANVKANHERFKSFSDKSIGKFFGKFHQRPVICAGAGPSLKGNVSDLKDRQSVPVISCLHNFHFLEDNDTPADFYVTLDAGDVTIEEVYEGGKEKPEHYWEKSKDRILLAYIGSSPRLLDKWQGEIYFYNCPVPDTDYMAEVEKVEKFNTFVTTGGNVLGACLYIAKAFMGASAIAYIGADFSFSYDKKFHGWESKYDKKLGHVLRVRDVFGNSVYTWQSYHNFKSFFEYISMTVPGQFFNCSEGGTLGAYSDGNLRSITQMPLKDFLNSLNCYEREMKDQAMNPKTDVKKLFF